MKKVVSFLLCCLMLTGIIGASAEAVDYSQHDEFTIWLYATPNEYYSDYSDNPVVKFLNEKFNVTLKYEQPAAGTEQDALSLMFGTGQYTDMIEVSQYTGSVQQLFEDGVIVDIAEYLDYMPNLKGYLESDEEFARFTYDDEGRILEIPNLRDVQEQIWGGLAYRRDILDTMTGGNIQFPSGNDEPITVEDWDYMLPLFKAYFEAAGMANYAVLIIPYTGIFNFGELQNGFGFTAPNYYVEDGQVKHGMLDEGLYAYLQKMNEWYEAGYIYADFASRVNDMFFLPNTELTYGGAAGIFYAINGMLYDTMSMPEYGLNFDLQPMRTPLMEGVDETTLLNRRSSRYENMGTGSVVTTTCHDIPKLLSIVDYLFSPEGGMMATVGLTKEQIPQSDHVYEAFDLMDGTYWYDENGDMQVNPLMQWVGGPLEVPYFAGHRIPHYDFSSITIDVTVEGHKKADRAWGAYDGGSKESLPTVLSYSVEDEKRIADTNVLLLDYISGMIPKFIMGSEPLNEDTFAAFVEHVRGLGIDECIEIQQEAYDRFMAR